MPQKSRTSTFKIFYFYMWYVFFGKNLLAIVWNSPQGHKNTIAFTDVYSWIQNSNSTCIWICLITKHIQLQTLSLFHFFKEPVGCPTVTTELMFNKQRSTSFRQASENRRLFGYHLIPCIQLSLQKVLWLLTSLYQIRKQTIGCEYLPKNGYR